MEAKQQIATLKAELEETLALPNTAAVRDLQLALVKKLNQLRDK